MDGAAVGGGDSERCIGVLGGRGVGGGIWRHKAEVELYSFKMNLFFI